MGRSDHVDAERLADGATVDYFDRHCHEYGRNRIKGVARLIRPYVDRDARLIDVGCGTGANLDRLSRALKVTDITALDASESSLVRVRERLPNADVRLGSLLDEGDMAPLRGQFDVVLMAAVLHHLVGTTRSTSRAYAEAGLREAARLVRPGGLVVVLEPVFTPRGPLAGLLAPNDALFWLKRAVTSVTAERVPVLGYWNNIGAPVVSFYTYDEVASTVIRAGLDPMIRDERQHSLGWPDAIVRRGDATFVARVPGGEGLRLQETTPRRRGGRSRRGPRQPSP